MDDREGRKVEHRRQAPRRSTMAIGAVILPDGRRIPCVLRDHSAGGARLAVAHRYTLPKTFIFVINGRDKAFQVERVWRRGDEVGIKLCEIAPTVPVQSDVYRPV